ncbi:MAG: sulfotransferase domain-containing protein, partial [Verrucomicrobiota bacterium]
LPLSHELRGDALAETGDTAGAIAAYEAAALYDNTHVNVLRKLAHLADKDWQPEKARTYAAMAEAAETKTEDPDNRLARLREEIEARRFTREQSMLWDETESADQLQEKLDRHSQQIDETLNPGPGATLDPGQEFLLVSGLPRSGTSLMMQLLTTAGIDALTDNHRAPDDFNPRGYFEWEDSKNLPANPHLIEQGLGKLTKIVSPLLPHLPPQHQYRVIFMTRPIEEVRLSQEKMLADHETTTPPGESLEEILAAHRKQTETFLTESDRFQILFVEYPDLIRDPKPVLEQILTFAADHLPAEIDAASLLDCIDPTLYRSRVTAEPSAAPEP